MSRGLVVLNIDRFSPKLALHNQRGSFSMSSVVGNKQKVDKLVMLCAYSISYVQITFTKKQEKKIIHIFVIVFA
jgi:hypothetical protein